MVVFLTGQQSVLCSVSLRVEPKPCKPSRILIPVDEYVDDAIDVDPVSHRIPDAPRRGLNYIYDTTTLYESCYDTSKRLHISLPPVVATAYALICTKYLSEVRQHNPFLLTRAAYAAEPSSRYPIDTQNLRMISLGGRLTAMNIAAYASVDDSIDHFYRLYGKKVPYMAELMDDSEAYTEGSTVPSDVYPNIFDAATSLQATMRLSRTPYPSLSALYYIIYGLCEWTFPCLHDIMYQDYLHYVSKCMVFPSCGAAPKALVEMRHVGEQLTGMTEQHFKQLRYITLRDVDHLPYYLLDETTLLLSAY